MRRSSNTQRCTYCLFRTSDDWGRQHFQGHLGHYLCVVGETSARFESTFQRVPRGLASARERQRTEEDGTRGKHCCHHHRHHGIDLRHFQCFAAESFTTTVI